MNPIGASATCELFSNIYGWYTVIPSNLSLSIKQASSESRCRVRLPILPENLFEISNRSGNSGDIIYISTIITFDNDPENFGIPDSYVFNNKGFDYAQGGKSSTVEINGTKYITAVAPTARTLSRWISKDVQKLGAGYRTVYVVPILDIIEWNPGDTLTDGTITSINLEFSAKSATATIEVQ